ncbi:MAG TPA: IS4 family transposase [Mobilitalea sp.]|nr:IS4 family transposase [Mobilitalea sp.]
MFHQTIKSLFSSSVISIVSDISQYTVNPKKDLSRNKKLPADKLISFLVSEGSSSTKNELLDFFDMDALAPSASAFNQQRAKLKPDALEAVFKLFNSSINSLENTSGYRFLAADGSTFTFFSKPSFASSEYYVSEGHSAKGFYSMHLNAFYDLDRHTYTDAIIQPVHNKDEFRAFCDIVDRHEILSNTKDIYIGDRGYCSYNNMAHVIEKGQYFLFRAKDIHSKGLVSRFDFPDDESFDITVKVTLVRNHSKKLIPTEGYMRFVDKATSFDFITYGSRDTYELSFRIVRFPLSDSSYECIITNLPIHEFPADRIKNVYFSRWGIESSFRKLKYSIGLSNFHAYKPEYIKQEIWAKLLTYNITEILINHVVVKQKETKHTYKVNFSVAAHICRVFLRLATEKGSISVMSLLKKELIPIRNERQYVRLKTAHFRKPRYFTYRAA